MSIAGIVTVIDYCGETEFYKGSPKYLHTEEGLVKYQSLSSFAYKSINVRKGILNDVKQGKDQQGHDYVFLNSIQTLSPLP